MNTQNELIEQLKNEISLLKEQNAILENKNIELTAKLNWFEEHYRLDQHRLYGRSGEKTICAEQLPSLWAEALSDINLRFPNLPLRKSPIDAKRDRDTGRRY